jgi:hypothetical protein
LVMDKTVIRSSREWILIICVSRNYIYVYI